MEELEGEDLVCDYIVGSGAEVRDPEQRVVLTYPMSMELCRRVYSVIREYPISMVICTDGCDYRIGTSEEVEESILMEAMLFHMDTDREAVRKTPLFQRMKNRTRAAASLDELEENGVPVYKLFLFREYAGSLGYAMDEVMVLGDSLNDLSMISMDFGATVAMENGDPEVKQAAKYITKSNEDLGVAYAIRELLKRQSEPCGDNGSPDGESI